MSSTLGLPNENNNEIMIGHELLLSLFGWKKTSHNEKISVWVASSILCSILRDNIECKSKFLSTPFYDGNKKDHPILTKVVEQLNLATKGTSIFDFLLYSYYFIFIYFLIFFIYLFFNIFLLFIFYLFFLFFLFYFFFFFIFLFI